MGTPPEFRKNPFTLVKKKNLKQLTSSEYLKEEKEKEKAVDKTKGTFQKSIYILVKDLRWSVLQKKKKKKKSKKNKKKKRFLAVNFFRKTLHLRCLTGFSIHLLPLTVNLKFLFDFKLEQLKGEIKLKVKYKLCKILFIIAPTKTSPKKDTVLLAESRKIHFEEFEQTCQHKPKRDVGKLCQRFC